MTPPVLHNGPARRLFLDRHALLEPPTGPAKGADLLALIDRLGFVQIDSINTVERAHHMILWARRHGYRPANLTPLLERDRSLFEHWTHDAAIIPTELFGHWKLRFARDAARIRARWTDWQGSAFHDRIAEVLAHVRAGGPVGSGEVGMGEARGRGGWWDWHPSKTALEYLWRTGVLSVRQRRGFAKIYDLTERVHPVAHAALAPTPAATIDWACRAALDRLGFATSGEIAAFWALVTPDEAKAWCAAAQRRGAVAEIAVEGADGTLRRCFARPGAIEAAAALPAPAAPIRILSPFDPVLRDRARAERLFGFRYRIEVFVPEAKRQFGYYVFPLLERDRLIGRIDLRCRRAEGRIAVAAFWPEAGITLTGARHARLEAALNRLGRFTDCTEIVFAEGWQRVPSCL